MGVDVQVSVRVPGELVEGLEGLAARGDRTLSAELRRAVRYYLDGMSVVREPVGDGRVVSDGLGVSRGVSRAADVVAVVPGLTTAAALVGEGSKRPSMSERLEGVEETPLPGKVPDRGGRR